MKLLKNLAMTLAIASAFIAPTAQANLITQDVAISTANSVRYLNFNVTTAGGFDISAFGSDTLNPDSFWNDDPEIFLFRNSLTSGNFIASDDDGGYDNNSLINNIFLNLGSYILAISEWDLTKDEAISGQNASSIQDPGSLRIQIEGDSFWAFNNYGGLYHVGAGTAAFAAVPEPGTIALIGLALAGIGLTRRRAQKQK